MAAVGPTGSRSAGGEGPDRGARCGVGPGGAVARSIEQSLSGREAGRWYSGVAGFRSGRGQTRCADRVKFAEFPGDKITDPRPESRFQSFFGFAEKSRSRTIWLTSISCDRVVRLDPGGGHGYILALGQGWKASLVFSVTRRSHERGQLDSCQPLPKQQ